MKKFIFIIISIINFGIMAIYLYFSKYDTIPMHFNIYGNADRYGSKWELLAITGIPVLIALIYTIAKAIRKYIGIEDENKKYSAKIFSALFVFIIVLSWFLTGMCMNYPKGIDKNALISVMTALWGGLMIFICNFMPKIKQNSAMGMRVTATLKSEKVWRKTHRLQGLIGVITGFITIIAGIISFMLGSFGMQIFFILVLITLITDCLIPYIYANVLYSKERKLK